MNILKTNSVLIENQEIIGTYDGSFLSRPNFNQVNEFYILYTLKRENTLDEYFLVESEIIQELNGNIKSLTDEDFEVLKRAKIAKNLDQCLFCSAIYELNTDEPQYFPVGSERVGFGTACYNCYNLARKIYKKTLSLTGRN